MPIGFESGDDFDRMANAVKGYEAMTGGPHPDPRSAVARHSQNRVTVRVTSTTPDADGWYSAVLVNRAVDQQQSESTTPTITGFTDSDWYDVDDADNVNKLLVKGLNEEALKAKRYDGWSIGMKGGYITAVVQVGGGVEGGMCNFTLPGPLLTTDASKASCTVNYYWAGSNPGSTITVYNQTASSNYMFSGSSGNHGIASYDADNTKWWIVQMQC